MKNSFLTILLLLIVFQAVTVHGQAGVLRQPPSIPAADKSKSDHMTLITNGWVDVRSILQTVAANAKLGLQIAPDVEGSVNLHLVDVPLKSVIAAVLEPTGLGWEIVGDALIVYKNGFITRWFTFNYPVTEREGRGELSVSPRASSGGGSGDSGKNESNVTSHSIMKVWPQVMTSVQTLVFEGGAGSSEASTENAGALSLADAEGRILVINPMAGLVRVTAELSRAKRVGVFLKRMEESLRRQVAISVRIFELTTMQGERSGINWQSLAKSDVAASLLTAEGLTAPVFNFTIDSKNGSALIQAISTQGELRVLSTPHITTLNNQKAIVRVVTEEVFYVAEVEPRVVLSGGAASDPVVEYQPQVISVGLVLDVTPQVGNDRVITLNVHPTISHIVRIETSPNQDTQPVIAIRELDTVGSVEDGQTLVIAGLLSHGVKQGRSGIPLLKDIPFLGYFFGKSHEEKTSTELVIMLTPTILDDTVRKSLVGDAEELIRSHQ